MGLSELLRLAVSLNGAFDIGCAFLALYAPHLSIAALHVGMFIQEKDYKHEILRRVMAYWLLSYGMVRLAFWQPGCVHPGLVACTYFLEAFAWWTEEVVYLTTHEEKTTMVSWMSIFLGVSTLLYAS